MKIIIAGGRAFDDYDLLKKEVSDFITDDCRCHVLIVSGGAKGADELGERFAKEIGCAVKAFKADWDKYGKYAGPIRNEEMAKYADACIVFWDGESKGTKNMINNAKKHNLRLKVVTYSDLEK